MRFFKAEENWLAEEFKRFVPVNVTTSFITLEPALVLAEDKYIRAVLGARLMERLAAYFELDAEERTDGVLNRVIELVQSAELRLAYWDSFDQLAVTITDHGLEDTMGDNRVYRYQADGLRENLQRQGFEQLEQLVEYLEAESSSFPEWEESEACTHKMKSVLPDSKRFFAIVGLKRDYRLFHGRTRQYIFTSSASAYHKPVEQYLITEGTTLANPYWQYSRDKIACEEYLMKKYRETGFPVTIVRPSHTYDERSVPLGVHGKNGSWQVLKRMLEGKPVIIHGDGTSLWTITHNSDFAKAYCGLVGNIHAIGQAYHITSDESVTWDQIYQIIADSLGVELNAVHIPSDFLADVSDYDLEGSLIVDSFLDRIVDPVAIRLLLVP